MKENKDIIESINCWRKRRRPWDKAFHLFLLLDIAKLLGGLVVVHCYLINFCLTIFWSTNWAHIWPLLRFPAFLMMRLISNLDLTYEKLGTWLKSHVLKQSAFLRTETLVHFLLEFYMVTKSRFGTLKSLIVKWKWCEPVSPWSKIIIA